MDLDTYHQGPFTNTMGRMFGSSRFMAPEEFALGATIDQQTTVFTLGRMAANFLSNGTLDRDPFRAADALYGVVVCACATERAVRFADVAAFVDAWDVARADQSVRETAIPSTEISAIAADQCTMTSPSHLPKDNIMSTPLLSADDYSKLPPIPPTERYQYGEDAEQFADLYLPAAPPADDTGYPVIILIHGGCWRAQYDLSPLSQFCSTIADLGVAVWSLEYRRIGNGGGWPMTFLDVAAGTDYLRTVAATHPLDLNRAVAVGHSAGGHLALWLAARHRLDKDSPIATADPLPLTGVLALAGIPDLTDAAEREICRGAVPELLGGTPEQVPERYRDGSPSAHLPLGVPQLLIIGLADQAVPTVHNEQYQDQALGAGDLVELTLLPETGHFEIVTPGTAVWPMVQETVLALLKQ